MRPQKITRLEQLMPGTMFLEVEAFGDGGFFQVNAPRVVVEGPSNIHLPTRQEREGEVGRTKWAPTAKWYAVVREVRGNPREKFAISIPTEDEVNIKRAPSDHSMFFHYTPELEQMLLGLSELKMYGADAPFRVLATM